MRSPGRKMAVQKIHTLSEIEAVQQIVETVRQAETGSAPFALVLGSGFSYGLVPTARELVEKSLPHWIQCLNTGEIFDGRKSATNPPAVAREFWGQFVQRNKNRGLDLPLDSVSGLPRDVPAAYRAAFDPNYV